MQIQRQILTETIAISPFEFILWYKNKIINKI